MIIVVRAQKTRAVDSRALEKVRRTPAVRASWQHRNSSAPSMQDRHDYVWSVLLISPDGPSSPSCRLFGRFHEFEVDAQYPYRDGLVTTALELIFECF
jgi:hypothetical protein